MNALIRRYFGDKARLDQLTLAYVLSGVLQGIALVLLIGFLRNFLDGNPSSAVPNFIWFTVFAIAAAVTYVFSAFWGSKISVFGACDTMIQAIGDRLVRLPLGWFDARSKARVIKVLKQDTNTVSHGPSVVLPVIATNLATLGTIMISALLIDWRMGLALALTTPAFWWLYKWQERELDAPTDEHETVVEDLGGRVVEFTQAQPVLRATGNVDEVWPVLGTVINSEADLNQSLQKAQAKPSTWFMITAMITMLVALVTGVLLVTAGDLDAITFIALMLIVTRFVEPLSLLIHYGAEVSHVKKAILNAASILDEPLLPEPDPAAEPNGEGCELNEVSFGYSKHEVLHNLSLRAAPRSVTALVGPSGSGKSTVLRLLARFWDTDEGAVLYGGRDVRDLGTEQVMSRVSMVFQNVYLFDTTIRENVLLARPDATNEELEEAALAAALDEVIDQLPEGWDTRVGEGGTRLSGGERQRVSLARAFLRDTPVVLLGHVSYVLSHWRMAWRTVAER